MDSQTHPAIQNQSGVLEARGLAGALANLAVLQALLDQELADACPDIIPCRRGCAFCCWQMNEMVSWLEAAQIFNVVRTWSAAQKAQLVQRAQREVDALMADPQVMQFANGDEITPDRLPVLASAMRRHVRPCVFLDRVDGGCMIYEARPTHCRVFGQSVVMRRDSDEPAFYGCEVAAGDVRAEIERAGELQLTDVTPFFKAQRTLEGAPHVTALPLAFWVKAVADGPDWSLDYPDALFERFLDAYQPMNFEVVRDEEKLGESSDQRND